MWVGAFLIIASVVYYLSTFQSAVQSHSAVGDVVYALVWLFDLPTGPSVFYRWLWGHWDWPEYPSLQRGQAPAAGGREEMSPSRDKHTHTHMCKQRNSARLTHTHMNGSVRVCKPCFTQNHTHTYITSHTTHNYSGKTCQRCLFSNLCSGGLQSWCYWWSLMLDGMCLVTFHQVVENFPQEICWIPAIPMKTLQ